MEFTQLKTLSKLQKTKIIDAIHIDDMDFLYVYFQSCTPYQLAEWVEANETPTYIKLYLDYFMDALPEFSGLFTLACLTQWSDHEKLDAIQKGTSDGEDFLPKDFEDFHKPYSETLGSSD